MGSFTGKILCVDLGARSAESRSVPPEVYEAVLAGKGLEALYLYKHIPAGADPLGPDNILAFAAGALCGTGAFLTGRWSVACKSPLTGGWGDANCGGLFAPAIKQCGYDAIFISGVSDEPVYLFCDGRTAEIRSAAEYWGLDATEAEGALHAALDGVCRKKPCIACIGPAGEKLSLISGICNEGGRIAARSGVGAVMGSKRLKAVVLAGSRPMPCADPEKVKAISKELGRKLLKMTLPTGLGVFLGAGGVMMGHLPNIPLDGALTSYMFREWGTQANTSLAITSGDGPIKNWAGTPRDVRLMDAVYNPEHINRIESAKYHCYSCPLGCGGKLNIRGRKYVEFDETHKPEYETIEAFGPLLLNWSLDSVYELNELLNRAGMDTISAGNTVAWAIECYENGLLTAEQTDGLELNWGNTEAIIALVKKMIARDGFGDALADGVKRASERFGGKEYAMHIGGQEPGMHDARNDPQLGVHFVAEPAPGKHTVGMSIQYGAMSLCEVFCLGASGKAAREIARSRGHGGAGDDLEGERLLHHADRRRGRLLLRADDGRAHVEAHRLPQRRRGLGAQRRPVYGDRRADPDPAAAVQRQAGRRSRLLPAAEAHAGRAPAGRRAAQGRDALEAPRADLRPLEGLRLGRKDRRAAAGDAGAAGHREADGGGDMTKKRPVFDYLNCVSCGICAQACPVSALGMRKEGKSGKYRNLFPELVKEGCIGCGGCAKSCPMEAVRMEDADEG